MATSSNNTTAAPKRATTRKTATTRKPATTTTTSTQPKTPVEQVQELAERAVLVPFGAGLLVRDNIVSTVKGLATKYSSRAGIERELKRYEKRGNTARTRLERKVRRQRTKFERDLRQRRNRIERLVRQNRRKLERDFKAVRKDLGKQGDLVTTRVEKLVADAQELISSAS